MPLPSIGPDTQTLQRQAEQLRADISNNSGRIERANFFLMRVVLAFALSGAGVAQNMNGNYTIGNPPNAGRAFSTEHADYGQQAEPKTDPPPHTPDHHSHARGRCNGRARRGGHNRRKEGGRAVETLS